MEMCGRLRALVTVLNGKEPLVMGGPHSQSGYFGKRGKSLHLLRIKPQTVQPVAKSLYVLTVVSWFCVHWELYVLASRLIYFVMRDEGHEESRSMQLRAVASIIDSVDMDGFDAAVRVVPQEGIKCIFAVWEGDCARARCCY
jgi:hypothetical protein